MWLVPEENSTKIVVGNADQAGSTSPAATIAAPISDLKALKISDGVFTLAFAAKAKRDGTIFKPQEEQQSLSNAKLYDNLFVRHWDTYVTPNSNAIWHTTLHKQKDMTVTRAGKYSLGNLTNILRDSGLESPIPTFGGLDNFDIGIKGICFVAKDPNLNPAFNTKSNFYYVPIEYEDDGPRYASPIMSVVEGFKGAATSPAFSEDGERAVFLQMKENGYESDRNNVFMVHVAEPRSAVELMGGSEAKELWDRSPSSVSFAGNSDILLLTAEEEGRVKLFKLDLSKDAADLDKRPMALTKKGSVSEVRNLGLETSRVLLSGTNLIDNSHYSILDVEDQGSLLQIISSNSQNGSRFRLSEDQISEIWFEGADAYKVHAWVIKPSDFDADKKYPLAYLIHGGPQGSWEDSWSTRWNPAVFAEQGYVVVTPNPTGSTGYGQAFTDAIKGHWGGRPYEDLVKGFEYIESEMDFVDVDRSVALGASYGGYMMAWMQGHPLAKRFKALVCHDGSFNLPAMLSSDEQYFPNHDFGGPPTVEPQAWNQWSPHAHISNWTTPMLVVHNELDYRLPISEGLAMFNVLQERDIKSRFLTFPDQNHWVLSEENSLVWHTIVLNWINSFVGLPQYKDEADLGVVIQN